MFRVLTHRRRSRLTSPRFVFVSLAPHVFAALVVVSVSRAGPLPPPPDEPGELRWIPVDPPAPADPTPPPPAPNPMREGSTRELVAPTHVPTGISEPDPDERPVDPGEFTGIGPVGDTVVAHPRPVIPTQPPGTDPPVPTDFSGMPIPAEYADEKPTLANLAEAGRLLQRHYPPIYADAGIPGLTVVEVVVEANGRVRPGSARVVESSHEQFGDAALRIVERFRFRPAKVGEQPVAVTVQVPIHWQPRD